MPKTTQRGKPTKAELPSTPERSNAKAQRTFAKAHDSAVEEYGEGQRAHRALRGIPAETYRNLDQICSSVTIVDGDAMDDAEKARARRSHTKPGLSETAKDVGVQNPIVEELGENRGS